MGKRVSQLDAAGPLTGAEQFAIVQNSRTKKVDIDVVKQYADTSCQCTLVSRYNTVSTGADTIETFAQTYQLPASTLDTNGSFLEIFAWGTFAANNNNKTIKIYFGSDSKSLTYSISNGNDGDWFINARIVRKTSTTQGGLIQFNANKDTVTPNSASGFNSVVAFTQDLSTDISISISITNGSASAGDITSDGLIIKLNKLDPDS